MQVVKMSFLCMKLLNTFNAYIIQYNTCHVKMFIIHPQFCDYSYINKTNTTQCLFGKD